MKKEENLSFSKEVAETLGLECAIILNLFMKNKFRRVKSNENIIESLMKDLPFINQEKVEESINKLSKFNLIELNREAQNDDYLVKKPPQTSESGKIESNWSPSDDTLEIIKMTEMSNDFIRHLAPNN